MFVSARLAETSTGVTERLRDTGKWGIWLRLRTRRCFGALDLRSARLRLKHSAYQVGNRRSRGIRAAFEQIIWQRQQNAPLRVLLPIATGGGKTRMAAAMLRRIFDAGLMGKALFVCDRTELRDNGLGDFQAAFGSDAAEVDTKHPQKNAKVLIATYQTLGDGGGDGPSPFPSDEVASTADEPSLPQPVVDVTFFLKHYPPGYFDVIVIDECHRSAWGKWFTILESNKQAIQIGLTATPREIKLPETKNALLAKQLTEDKRLTESTPAVLLDFIAEKGKEADAALGRLRGLVTRG